MHMTATLTRWYEEHGRHEIFAGGKHAPMVSTAHSLSLNQEAVQSGAQTELDESGVPKNSREEKIMARLIRHHLLREQPLVQIQKSSNHDKSGAQTDIE
jgi:hypothetical protein